MKLFELKPCSKCPRSVCAELTASKCPFDYDDEITKEDIKALETHVEKHFGPVEELVTVDGPAW